MSGFFYPPGSSSSSVSGPFTLSAKISPPALASGTTVNYNPTGLATIARVRLTTNVAGSSIGGFAAQVDGFTLWLFNLGPGDLILIDEDAGTLAVNRFALPSDFLIPMDYGWIIEYDIDSLRWRLI